MKSRTEELAFIVEDMFQLIPDPNQLEYKPTLDRLGIPTGGIEEEVWWKRMDEMVMLEKSKLHRQVAELEATVESEHAMRMEAERQLAELKGAVA